jgi:phage protein U
MYAKLGDIEYKGLLVFNDFSRERSVNYAEHQLINEVPRLQKISARNLTVINFGYHFSYSFCDPEYEVQALIDRMNAGEVLPLIDGSGKSLGDFVITKTKETINTIDPVIGNILDVNVELELKEYVAPKKFGAKVQGFALKSYTPNIVPITSLEGTDQLFCGLITTEIDSMIIIIDDQMALATKVSSLAKVVSLLNKAKDKIDSARAAYARLYDKYNKVQEGIAKAITTFRSVLQSAENARNSIERTKQAITQAQQAAINAQNSLNAAIADPNDPEAIKKAINGTNELGRSHRNVRTAGAEVAYLTGARKGFK